MFAWTDDDDEDEFRRVKRKRAGEGDKDEEMEVGSSKSYREMLTLSHPSSANQPYGIVVLGTTI